MVLTEDPNSLVLSHHNRPDSLSDLQIPGTHIVRTHMSKGNSHGRNNLRKTYPINIILQVDGKKWLRNDVIGRLSQIVFPSAWFSVLIIQEEIVPRLIQCSFFLGLVMESRCMCVPGPYTYMHMSERTATLLCGGPVENRGHRAAHPVLHTHCATQA